MEDSPQKFLARRIVEGAVERVGVGIDVRHVVPIPLILEMESRRPDR